MKKRLSLLVFFFTLLGGANLVFSRTVWTGEQVVGWNEDFPLTTQQLGTLNAGDYFVFTYTVAENAEWPQFRLEDMSYNVQEGISLTTGMTSSRIYVTNSMITALASGARIRGTGCTMTQIDLEDGDGGNYSNAIWIGEKTFPSTWGTYLTLSASLFTGKGNYILRMYHEEVKMGAQMNFNYTIYNSQTKQNGWATLPNTTGMSVDGVSTQITLTSEMITAITTTTDGDSHTDLGNLHISGVGFTLKHVDIIDPSTQKTLTCSVPVTNDWKWDSGTPTFTINVQNDNAEAVTANAQLLIVTDKYATVTTLSDSKSISASGSDAITLTMDAAPSAGIYHAVAIVNDVTVRAFNFAYNPTAISSPADKQSDFATFWSSAKTQLDGISISATLTELNGTDDKASKSTSARKVYLVEMQSIPDGTSGDPVTIRGYYCEPTDGQKHPVIMHYLGYDSEYAPGGTDTKPYCPSGDANPDYAEFYLSTRGQSINNRAASEREADGKGNFTNTYGDWFAFNFGNKDSYYYRGAYMDCVRALDFMASRETSDMSNLFAEGQSQGGAFTYAAAALSGYTFKAIAPAIPFMGDFPDYFQVGTWPASVATANQGTMTDEEMYAFLSYFDTKNLATMISCPVITSIGIQDNVCPPHTNLAPYNNLNTPAADKQIVYNAELGHQVNASWSSTYNNFFDRYDETPSILWNKTVDYTETEWGTYGTINATKLEEADLQPGDMLCVTVSEASKTTTQYPKVAFYSSNGSVNLDKECGYWDEVDASASFPITKKVRLTRSVLKKIYANDYILNMIGGGCKLEKVTIERFASKLWEGESGLLNWNVAYTVPVELVEDLKAGDQLKVTVKRKGSTAEWPKLTIHSASDLSERKNEYNIVTLHTFEAKNESSFPQVVTYTVTDEDSKVTREKNSIYLSGEDVEFTKVELVRAESTTTSVSAAQYATYYHTYPVQLPSGVKAATIDGASDGTLTIHWRYDGSSGNNVIPGETAVLLKATSGSKTLTFVPDNYEAAPTGNMLHGHDSEDETTGDGKHYKLSYNSSGTDLGWYYGAANGAAFTIGAHKAWLVIPSGTPAPSHFLLNEEEAIATDLLEGSKDSSSSNGSNSIKFFQNGRLLILRDGITYDVMGRVVK